MFANQYTLCILLPFLVSAISGFIFTPQIISFCLKRKLYDLPNERKVHHSAIPRLGGVAFLPCMLLAFLVAMLVLSSLTPGMPVKVGLWSCVFLISIFMIYVVGIVDDLVGLGARTKFVVQIIAASLMPLSGLWVNDLYGLFGIYEIPFWVGATITVFILVFIDNAMNLIDGIDGLSAGLALISLTGFLYCFAREGIWSYCVMVSGMMGVITAYLYYNLFGKAEKKRKIFMGDSGSLTIGFILGFLFIKFAMNNTAIMPYRSDSLLLAYTLLIVPCFDVVRVALTRIRKGTSIFHPDKNHIHHKLMRSGLSQHASLAVILLLALLFCLINVLLLKVTKITVIVISDVVIYILFQLALNMIIRHHGQKAIE